MQFRADAVGSYRQHRVRQPFVFAGIPPDQVERLKQPFTRASIARAREDGAAGAGLGLAIVDRIARMHGGTFDLSPRDGGGTLARVTFPVPK
jgi:two-component system osmolarity sensor histidine kinase EnvZ